MKKDFLSLILLGSVVSSYAASADVDTLNKQIQNPVADLISLPLQSNWGFNVGPNNDTQYLLNVQPVIPLHITEHWNIITRMVMPITDQPSFVSGGSNTFGLANTTLSFFASPVNNSDFIFGAGPAIFTPSATNSVLGSNRWGAGPSIVSLVQKGHWTVGMLFNQIWSFDGSSGSNPNAVNSMLTQPFLAYVLKDGWSLSFVSETTANWNASSSNRWTVPMDFLVNKIVMLHK